MKPKFFLLFSLFSLVSFALEEVDAINADEEKAIRYCSHNGTSREDILQLLTHSKIRQDTTTYNESTSEYPYYLFDGSPYEDGMWEFEPELRLWDPDSIDIDATRESLRGKNISVSVNWASIRNKAILYNALYSMGFTDSLNHEDLYWAIDVSADSLGHVNKLCRNAFTPSFLNEERLEKVRNYLDSCGLLITTIIPSDRIYLDFYEPSDFEAVSLGQIPAVIQTMKHPWLCLIGTYFDYWFEKQYNASRNISGMLFDETFISPCNITLPDVDSKNYNDAVFVLSMIYVFGDHAVDLFLGKFNFSVELCVDSKGVVADMFSIQGDSPLSDTEISRLKKFLIHNKIEFEIPARSNSNKLIVNFPDACYSEKLKPMQYYHRIDIHETMLRSLIHKYLILKVPDAES